MDMNKIICDRCGKEVELTDEYLRVAYHPRLKCVQMFNSKKDLCPYCSYIFKLFMEKR